jgi:hypothetical protein
MEWFLAWVIAAGICSTIYALAILIYKIWNAINLVLSSAKGQKYFESYMNKRIDQVLELHTSNWNHIIEIRKELRNVQGAVGKLIDESKEKSNVVND